MLTKKHYKAIAEVVAGLPRKSVNGTDMVSVDALVFWLARFFEKDNVNFDYQKFRDACRYV